MTHIRFCVQVFFFLRLAKIQTAFANCGLHGWRIRFGFYLLLMYSFYFSSALPPSLQERERKWLSSRNESTITISITYHIHDTRNYSYQFGRSTSKLINKTREMHREIEWDRERLLETKRHYLMPCWTFRHPASTFSFHFILHRCIGTVAWTFTQYSR